MSKLTSDKWESFCLQTNSKTRARKLIGLINNVNKDGRKQIRKDVDDLLLYNLEHADIFKLMMIHYTLDDIVELLSRMLTYLEKNEKKLEKIEKRLCSLEQYPISSSEVDLKKKLKDEMNEIVADEEKYANS